MPGLVDVLIICPIDIEYEYLRMAFNIERFFVLEVDPFNELCKSQFFARVTSTAEHHSLIDVCVVQALKQGVLEAACLTSRLLTEIKPKLVISFGIAGLFDNEIELSSVCYPESVIYYEPAKDTEKNTIPNVRWVNDLEKQVEIERRSVSSERLFAPVQFNCDRHLYIAPPLSQFGLFKVILDKPLASGEKLVAASKSQARSDATTTNRNVIGVDMEAAGVACACKAAPGYLRPHYLVVKGFSDRATKESKNPDLNATTLEDQLAAKEKQRQERAAAAKNASMFLIKLLIHNCTKIERSPPPGEERTKTDIDSKLAKFKKSSFLSSVTTLRPNDHRMTRAIIAPNVPSIYHFTISPDGIIGWVDLYFLLIQRKLQHDCDFIPQVFISESDTISHDTRQRVERFVGRVLTDKKPWNIYWSSTIDAMNYRHRAYAEAYRGVGFEYFNQVIDRNKISIKNTLPKAKTDRWLIFQIWLSRVMPTQVILAFYKRAELYDMLLDVPGMDPVIIYGDTLALGEDPSLESKVHERMKKLGVDSLSASPLVEWFRNELEANSSVGVEALCRFVDYFKPLCPIEENIIIDKAYSDWITCVLESAAPRAAEDNKDLFVRFSKLVGYWKHQFLNPGNNNA